MIHVLIGDGKGKTSSAIGIAIRASGHHIPVLFIQFLKDGTSGEISILKNINGVTVEYAPESYGFLFQMSKEQVERTAEMDNQLLDIAIASNAGLIILDEILHVIDAGLVERKKIEKILEYQAEIVMTGYNAPQWIIDRADYVSRIEKIKHPYDKGIIARKGIEF